MDRMPNNVFRQAEIVAVHPESNSVDIVYLDDGSRVSDVPIMSPSSSTRSGTVDLPDIESREDEDIDITNTEQLRAQAVIGMCAGRPIVIGYQSPPVNELAFQGMPNMRVWRHASDTHSITQDDGSIELQHPSGAFVKLGSGVAKTDLSGRDYDGKWQIRRNLDVSMHLRIELGGSTVTMYPDGRVVISAAGDVEITSAQKISLTGACVLANGSPISRIGDKDSNGDRMVEGAC